MRRPKNIPFFTDNDVPNRVGDFLIQRGHSVVRLRDVMLQDSPDPVVATNCRENGLVLITHNVKDFKKIVKEHEVTKKEVDRLNRVEMCCHHVRSLERITEAIDVIEREWVRLGRKKVGLRISVGAQQIRINR